MLAYQGTVQDDEYHKKIVKADTTLRDVDGDTALMLAIRQSKFEIAVIIANGMNAKEYAIENKQKQTAFELLKKKKTSSADKWYDILFKLLQ